MRDEMLKRLDDFVDRTCGRCEGEYDFDDLRAEWATLRAELVAERCEHCRFWGNGSAGYANCAMVKQGTLPGAYLDEPDGEGAQVVTRDGFCCSHFEKKGL